MSKHTRITAEPVKRIDAAQELDIVRAAFLRSPSAMMRRRLAAMLLLGGGFDEAIVLLADAEGLTFEESLTLARAYLSLETSADTQRALEAAQHAVGLASGDRELAGSLADLGKAQVRVGDVGGARATLTRALGHDPHNKNACKRLAAIELNGGDHHAVLEMVDRLAEKGAAHARLFAARVLAHAKNGDIGAARAAAALHEFQFSERLAPPPGWSNIEAFNAELARELLRHPGLRYNRYGAASEKTWRIDAPAMGAAPMVQLLLDQIARTVGEHVDRIANADHPWMHARPPSATLHSWCVITEGDGFETWHVHQFGWLSGVYYIQVPQAVAEGSDEGGCLAFGLPEDLAGREAASAFGLQLVRPQPGLMMLFPSHTYHRTFPHSTNERRICFAFDIWPY